MNGKRKYYFDNKKELKQCSKCLDIKSFYNFVKDNSNGTGLFGWCKQCQSDHRKIWDKENSEKNPWYGSYTNAKQRCTNPRNPNYPWWGAKGIKFLLTKEECAKLWKRDKADLMKYPTIDRIENDGDYKYDNCQFLENKDNSMKDNVGHMYKGRYIKYCKIGQYDKEDKLIKVWNSQGEASRGLRLHQGDISHCVNNIKVKTVGGFIFKKEIDNEL